MLSLRTSVVGTSGIARLTLFELAQHTRPSYHHPPPKSPSSGAYSVSLSRASVPVFAITM